MAVEYDFDLGVLCVVIPPAVGTSLTLLSLTGQSAILLRFLNLRFHDVGAMPLGTDSLHLTLVIKGCKWNGGEISALSCSGS